MIEEIQGEFNDTLRGDAEQFGGEGESQVVPTYHVRVTSADLAGFYETRDPLVIGEVALVWRLDPPQTEPEVDFVAFVGQGTVERLTRGETVNYGIRQIDGENQTLHVSKGGISDLFEDERSPTERIREDKPHLRGYL